MDWVKRSFEMPAPVHQRLKERARALRHGKEGLLRFLYAGIGLWAAQQSDESLRQIIRTIEELERMPESEAQRVMQAMMEAQPRDEGAVQRYVERGREIFAEVVRRREEREPRRPRRRDRGVG